MNTSDAFWPSNLGLFGMIPLSGCARKTQRGFSKSLLASLVREVQVLCQADQFGAETTATFGNSPKIDTLWKARSRLYPPTFPSKSPFCSIFPSRDRRDALDFKLPSIQTILYNSRYRRFFPTFAPLQAQQHSNDPARKPAILMTFQENVSWQTFDMSSV